MSGTNVAEWHRSSVTIVVADREPRTEWAMPVRLGLWWESAALGVPHTIVSWDTTAYDAMGVAA